MSGLLFANLLDERIERGGVRIHRVNGHIGRLFAPMLPVASLRHAAPTNLDVSLGLALAHARRAVGAQRELSLIVVGIEQLGRGLVGS